MGKCKRCRVSMRFFDISALCDRCKMLCCLEHGEVALCRHADYVIELIDNRQITTSDYIKYRDKILLAMAQKRIDDLSFMKQSIERAYGNNTIENIATKE